MVSMGMKMNVDTYQARVSMRTIYEATQLIRRGAVTNDVILASYRFLDRGFNVHMAGAGNRPELSHMFDWGMEGTSAASGRLWKTLMGGQGSKKVVSYNFVDSRKKVPFDPEIEDILKRRHVFKKKAEVFEQGQTVKISPRYARFLVYVNRHKGKGYTAGDKPPQVTKDNVTFTQRTSYIGEAGGGKYMGKFDAEFVSYWGGLGSAQHIADQLARSSSVAVARKAGAQKRVKAMADGSKDAGPEGKAKAQQVIKQIKRDMKGAI